MARFWIAPDAGNTDRLQTLAAIMALEFIMVHSGVFMAVMPRKISLFLLVPFYGLFAWAMSSAVPGNTILWIYFGVVLLRMRFAFSEPDSPEKNAAIFISCLAVIVYFVLVFIFAFGSHFIPQLGLTESFLIDSGYRAQITSGGLFIDSPHVPLAMGVVYFAVLALIEIGVSRLFRQPDKHVD